MTRTRTQLLLGLSIMFWGFALSGILLVTWAGPWVAFLVAAVIYVVIVARVSR